MIFARCEVKLKRFFLVFRLQVRRKEDKTKLHELIELVKAEQTIANSAEVNTILQVRFLEEPRERWMLVQLLVGPNFSHDPDAMQTCILDRLAHSFPTSDSMTKQAVSRGEEAEFGSTRYFLCTCFGYPNG